ncbi:MAG: hypothetical protein IJW23_09660 [Lentisphaeria bacterium]|nr:hypothetical protein [Lentisphaeria bacterium]
MTKDLSKNLDYRLPDDYPAPGEILPRRLQDGKECKFTGGWGYDKENAVVITETDPSEGVSLEYEFIEQRAYEELIFSRQNGEEYRGIHLGSPSQSLHDINGVPHDHIEMEVTALPLKAWEELRADILAHNGYEDDEAGKARLQERIETVKITYKTECWFNISEFFGKYSF